jgi:type II secretory pathway component PulM
MLKPLEKYLTSLKKREKLLLYSIVFISLPFLSHEFILRNLEMDIKKVERQIQAKKRDRKDFIESIDVDEKALKDRVRKKVELVSKLKKEKNFILEEIEKAPKINKNTLLSQISESSEKFQVEIMRTKFLKNSVEIFYKSTFENSLLFINSFEKKPFLKVLNIEIIEKEKTETTLTIKI